MKRRKLSRLIAIVIVDGFIALSVCALIVVPLVAIVLPLVWLVGSP